MALAGMQLMLKLPFALVSEQPAPDCVTDTVALADFVGSDTDVAFTTSNNHCIFLWLRTTRVALHARDYARRKLQQ
jgi:hypothetical protein